MKQDFPHNYSIVNASRELGLSDGLYGIARPLTDAQKRQKMADRMLAASIRAEECRITASIKLPPVAPFVRRKTVTEQLEVESRASFNRGIPTIPVISSAKFSSEWIAFERKGMPVSHDTLVKVCLLDGSVHGPFPAYKYNWNEHTSIQSYCLEELPGMSADSVDGWIKWDGGENPAPGKNVELRLANGDQDEFASDYAKWMGKEDFAKIYEWAPNNYITHYRVIIPYIEPKAEPDWHDPEKELPKVDGVYRINRTDCRNPFCYSKFSCNSFFLMDSDVKRAATWNITTGSPLGKFQWRELTADEAKQLDNA